MCEHFFLKRWMRLSVLSIIALGMDISRNQLITTPKPLHRHPVLSPYHATCQVLGDTLSILALHWLLCSRASHRENLLASNLYARDSIPDTKKQLYYLKTFKTTKTFSTQNLHIRKFFRTFAPVISPRLGIMSFGWVVTDIIRRQNGVPDKTRFIGCPTRFVLGYMESGKFNVNPTHCSILMSSGYVYLSPYT